MTVPIRAEAFRFLLAGAINTAVTYIIYYALLSWLDYVLAYSIAFSIGVLLSFYLNARFVFRVAATWRKLLLYPTVYVVQYFLGVGVLWIAVERMALSKPLAMLLVIGVSIPVTFLLTRSILSKDQSLN